jgi:phosphatidylglycerophosphate synthase
VPRQRILTLPNLLTLVRVPLAGAVWLVTDRPALLIAVMVAAAVSDLADGRFARAIRARRIRAGVDHGLLGEAGGIGSWLDPLCDKLFVLSLLAAIYVSHDPGPLVVALIATRELVLVPLVGLYKLIPRERRKRRFDFRAGLVGKLATVGQFAAVAAIALAPDMVWPLSIVAAITGALAVVHYLKRAAAAMQDALSP